ncbi:hypothetical protein AMS68_001262 [Peltaster fructicola]|uniref:PH domain-containing protein n=1 Tax=Peltaster fructicola TaxID=286661 RepID=A0A6H0XM88_9PEZI|nr:hypothetical protein AMS68_001262 [Peltaster fructicola]
MLVGNSVPEYIFTRFAISALRIIAPLSIAYIIALAIQALVLSDTIRLPLLVEVYLFLEAAFFFVVYLPYRRLLQSAADHPKALGKVERQALFNRILNSVSHVDHYLSGWFLGVPIGDVDRASLKEFLAWSLMNEHLEKLDTSQNAELDAYINALEEKLDHKLKTTKSTSRSLRTTFDDVPMQHRPLVWYLTMSQSDGDVGIVVVEILPISSRICPPALSTSEMKAQIRQILDTHGWTEFVLIGHSYGTAIASTILRDPVFSLRVKAAMLLDPICFLLHLPDVAYNFTRRKPRRANERMLHYFSSQDMLISHTLARRFFWSEYVLWEEDLDDNLPLTVVLSAKDLIVPTMEVWDYLTSSTPCETDIQSVEQLAGTIEWRDGKRQVLWFKDFDHAGLFSSKGARRVLSFMSQWGSHAQDSSSTTSPKTSSNNGRVVPVLDTTATQSNNSRVDSFPRSPTPQSPSTPSRARGDSRTGGRPLSMIQTYQAPQVEVATDTPPELQPIFSFLNSHGNKLYQEGYFLKLHDLDARGRPSADRTWVECFAQLVGTVLSLWDAAALDAAGVDGEVMPTFINLSDASLKMIESLPMSGAQGGKLQNVLSISTAANNRYLLHFNSLNSLTQWTAGIRLAMFEHATLQEAYTGSLVAGKGRYLISIKAIMERARYPTEDWARVRFGAGTPWRRLWFVITPPDEKEYQKAKKMVSKGGSYLRSQLPRGDIKFYDTKKIQKKTQPVATINDVYAAYAIYPQSKPLIDQSTLVKMEGLVTIHSSPETTAEGFVFIMPEVHAAVSGFEMMLRWLFPVWDTFNLYGRPNKLIADTLDQRGLMFAMPRDRRYGYLDILDVSGLIHETGSQTWSERQWRKQMKKLTAERMNKQLEGAPIYGHRRSATGSQSSLPNAPRGVRFNDADSTHSNQSRSASPAPGPFAPPKRVDSAPPTQRSSPHKRAASEAQNYKRYQADTPSRLSHEMDRGNDYRPMPPPHSVKPYTQQGPGTLQRIESGLATPTMGSMQAGLHPTTDAVEVPPEPVSSPPAFTHNPGAKPMHSPRNMPELRRAHSGVDTTTLSQMHDAATVQGAEDDYGNLVPHKDHLPPTPQ